MIKAALVVWKLVSTQPLPSGEQVDHRNEPSFFGGVAFNGTDVAFRFSSGN
jgi:hypothetical protein